MRRGKGRGGGRGGGRGRNGRAQTFEAQRRQLQLRDRGGDGKNFKGVIITSCGNNNRQAVQEFLNLLQQCCCSNSDSEAISSTYSPVAATAEGREEEICAADVMAEALTAEACELRQQQRRFIPVKDIVKGVTFVQFTQQEDVPSELVHALLQQLISSPHKYSCRYVSRVLPVDRTAAPQLEALRALVTPLIAASMPLSAAAVAAAAPAGGVGSEQQDEDVASPTAAAATGEVAEQQQQEEEEAVGEGDSQQQQQKEGAGERERAAGAGSSAAAATARRSKEEREEERRSAAAAERDEEQEKGEMKEIGRARAVAAAAVGRVESRAEFSTGKEKTQTTATEKNKKETWACQFNSRGFDTIKKKDVLEMLATLVGCNYTVDILHATYSLLIECNPVFCGVAVVKDFGRFYRYNAHRCCHPEAEQQQAKRKERDEEEEEEEEEKEDVKQEKLNKRDEENDEMGERTSEKIEKEEKADTQNAVSASSSVEAAAAAAAAEAAREQESRTTSTIEEFAEKEKKRRLFDDSGSENMNVKTQRLAS